METKGGAALFIMHLERSGGESNKFESVICIDCGDASGSATDNATSRRKVPTQEMVPNTFPNTIYTINNFINMV